MKTLKNELKSSILNLFFIIPCLIGIGIAVTDAVLNIKEYNLYYEENILSDMKEIGNIFMPLNVAYTYWIGSQNPLKTSVIFFCFVLFVAFVPSIYIIYKRKKENTLLTTNSISEYLSSFITSGLIAFIPLAVNFICILMFVPADTPDSVYDIYYGVFSINLFSDLFYSCPVIYELIYMLILFAFSGLLGCFAYGTAKLFNGCPIFLLVPDLIMLALFLINKYYKPIISTSPINDYFSASELFRNYHLLEQSFAVLIIATALITLINKFKKIKHEEADI